MDDSSSGSLHMRAQCEDSASDALHPQAYEDTAAGPVGRGGTGRSEPGSGAAKQTGSAILRVLSTRLH